MQENNQKLTLLVMLTIQTHIVRKVYRQVTPGATTTNLATNARLSQLAGQYMTSQLLPRE